MKQLYANTLTYVRSKNFGLFPILLCILVCLGAGCTSLRPNFETPSVVITSFKPLISESFIPRFEIGMRVVNPNATELRLRGMGYKIFLNEYEVVAGVANELPVVPAYGESEFTVNATADLIEGVRFIGGLLGKTSGQVAYRIQTKLDIGAMEPAIRIEKTGNFSPEKTGNFSPEKTGNFSP